MLHHREKVGLVVRVFAGNAKYAQKALDNAQAVVDQALPLSIQEKTVFSEILFVVPMDTRRKDHDVAGTADALEEIFRSEKRVRVLRITEGDIFCTALNDAMLDQYGRSVHYSAIWSPEAISMLTEGNVERMMTAIDQGARVAGLAFPDLGNTVQEGQIANTAAMWDNRTVLKKGGFPQDAGQPQTGSCTELWVHDSDTAGNKVEYLSAGVEETGLLIEMVREYDKCIAPIVPEGGKWDHAHKDDPERAAREAAKLASKQARKQLHALRRNCTLEFLRTGVMDAYRTF